MTRQHRVRGLGLLVAFSGALMITGCANEQGVPDDAQPAAAGSDLGERHGDPRVSRGFAIAPVPLNLHGKQHDLVGRGSYIVNAQGGCNDCHTSPPYAAGHDPFQGQPKQVQAATYLAGGTAFGPFISTNLTPDPATGRPAGLTYTQFCNVMRTGRDPDDASRLLQVMPWPVYGSMIDEDLRAIYEYLRTIPSSCAPAPNPCRP